MAKIEAKWLNLDSNMLQDDGSGNLQINLGANLSADVSGIFVSIATDQNFNSKKIINLADGSAPGDATNYSQLQSVSTQGKLWKEQLLTINQLTDGSPTGGILAAQVLKLNNDLQAGDTIIIDDGTSPVETYTAVAGSPGSPNLYEFEVGVSVNVSLSNLSLAINTSSSMVSTTVASLSTIDATNNILLLWQDTIGEPTRVYGTINSSPNPVEIADTSLTNLYEATSTDMISLPAVDPAATNFGFSRETSELISNETHMVRDVDISYTWDGDGNVWNSTGSASIPNATKSLGGKVQVGDGLSASAGILSLDLAANQGLILAGSPYPQLQIDYDDSTIGIVSNKLAVKPGGIGSTQLAPALSVDITGGTINGIAIGATTPLTELSVDNIELNGNTISSTSGNIVLSPDISSSPNGIIEFSSDFVPTVDDSFYIGSPDKRVKGIYMASTFDLSEKLDFRFGDKTVLSLFYEEDKMVLDAKDHPLKLDANIVQIDDLNFAANTIESNSMLVRARSGGITIDSVSDEINLVSPMLNFVGDNVGDISISGFSTINVGSSKGLQWNMLSENESDSEFTISAEGSSNSDVKNVLTLVHSRTSGVGADGIGVGMKYRVEDDAGVIRDVAQISGSLTDATSITGKLHLLTSSGGVLTEVLSIDHEGNVFFSGKINNALEIEQSQHDRTFVKLSSTGILTIFDDVDDVIPNAKVNIISADLPLSVVRSCQNSRNLPHDVLDLSVNSYFTAIDGFGPRMNFKVDGCTIGSISFVQDGDYAGKVIINNGLNATNPIFVGQADGKIVLADNIITPNSKVTIESSNQETVLLLQSTGTSVANTQDIFNLKAKTINDMDDGYGVSINALIEDNSNKTNKIGSIAFMRENSDNCGQIALFSAGEYGLTCGFAVHGDSKSMFCYDAYKSYPKARIHVKDSDIPMILERLSNNNQILSNLILKRSCKDLKGNIGVRLDAEIATNNKSFSIGYLDFIATEGSEASQVDFQLVNNSSISTALSINPESVTTFNMYPRNNTCSIGRSDMMYDDTWFKNGSITSSDDALQTDVEELQHGSEFLSHLNPVQFRWINGSRLHFAILSQELEIVLQELDIDTSDFAAFIKDTETNNYALRYHEFIPILIKASNEHRRTISTLKQEKQDLVERILNLENIIRSFEERLAVLEN